ncbi:BppU family phage baseplate upper protein [Staphylococcus simiae]|uniref:Uncharacterized protein n=1 Tax=Staphylococcus simiae CCM 7213 = CCUG 51256 TaxID=911238 RepID=G5JH99_9STAP|nr:BppU family phage baseplate upper protein [Staphylococcus simiae]EHJ08447.1 hypothetical protein SS7213T_04140 [Staphylococcus simiae CCM 7213 = CCUG 51256]PNZ12551.1 DUF2479 domain-containing protein [Staphylococcus simiae]SNV67481.1 phage protein [Staphylococcus simiae]
MTNGIDKKALFKFQSEPYLKPISDLGVGFYNLDENTAILKFQLSNVHGPLLIHENNLTAYAYFESSNGSASDVIELQIEDEFKGVVSITLDKDFLQACTSTVVTGQVYIAVNNVDGNPKNNEVAVFREFKFEVADALINKISSFTKIEYIRMFDQLKMHIEKRVKDIEKAIANGVDYVAEMKEVLQKGLQQINETVEKAKNEISNKTQNVVNNINGISNTSINKLESITKTYMKESEGIKNDVLNAINRGDFISKETLSSNINQALNQAIKFDDQTLRNAQQYIDNKAWQKHKLTNDDGASRMFDGINFNTLQLETGFYFLTNAINGPANDGYLYVIKRSYGFSSILFITLDSNIIYTRQKYNGVWKKFERITQDFSDTGWIPMTLVNNAKPYSDKDIPMLKLTDNQGSLTLHFKGAVKGITARDAVIAILPNNVSSKINRDYAFLQNTSIKGGIANIARWGVKENGDIKMERVSFPQGDMSETDWYPIDISICL